MVLIETQPLTTSFSEFEWRAARLEDAVGIHAMLLKRDQVDHIHGAGTLTGIQKELQDPWLIDRDQDTCVAISPQGEVAAFAIIFVNPESDADADLQAHLWMEVHPDYRVDGLRRALAEWALQRAKVRLASLSDDLPRKVQVSADEKLADHKMVYEALGFVSVRYFYHMRRHLSQPIIAPKLPAGLQLVTYQPEDSEGLHAAFNDAFADHWNFYPASKADWELWFVGGEDFRPDLTLLVKDGDEIAAFSINGVNPERNAQRGVQEGWVHQLGTRRPWRKRGLATQLLLASMQAFKADGLEYATLGVDTENPTGALKIYEKVGFEPFRSFVVYEMGLDGCQA
ncbi:MAG: GNAT family N-acetyltransferase [Anaerolineales bacterium]